MCKVVAGEKESWIFMRKVIFVFFLMMAVVGTRGQGQPAQGKLAFEVASVHPSPALDMSKLAAQIQAGSMPRFGAHVDGTRAEYVYMSLKELVANAYGLKAYQVSGPAWLGSERFDIVAKMPDGSSKDDAPAMLRSLLEERFKLTAHSDKQEHPVLGLVVGKAGPKLKDGIAPATPPEPIDENAPLKPGEFRMQGPDGPIHITRNGDGTMTMNMGKNGIVTQKMDMQTQTMHMESSYVTMPGFADMLTNLMQMGGAGGPQVVDMTELKGNYQVALDFSLVDLMAMIRERAKEMGMTMPGGPAGGGGGATDNLPASGVTDPAGRSSVYASVEKLGLKLESRKAPVEQVMVESIEKTPTEN